MRLSSRVLLSCALLLPGAALSQPTPQTAGAAVTIQAFGEVTRANDEARATFTVEEQDKDQAAAASRANRRMREGMEILQREDPQAKLRTSGYYTHPVYAEAPPSLPGRTRPIVAWRVGQSLEMTTTRLESLPRTVAAAQRVLALNGIGFGLSSEAQRAMDRERIAAAWRHLTERIAAVAQAMGRSASEATVESVELDAPEPVRPLMAMRAQTMAQPEAAAVQEPRFEAGETTLQMRIVGRVRFK